MKLLIIVTLSLMSSMTFANITRPATSSEKAKLCVAVDAALTQENADLAVDMDKCLKAKLISSGHYLHGRVVQGTVPFNSPEGSFTMNCRGIVKADQISPKNVTCN